MTANGRPQPDNSGDTEPKYTAEDEAQELLEWRDLQNAQIDSMMHVWDNPQDEVWNDA